MTPHPNTLVDCHTRIGRVFDRLAATTNGHARAKLLIDAADLQLDMAQLHRDNSEHAAGERCTVLARMLDALADVEFVACRSLSRRVATSTEFEDVAGPILDKMAATTDLTGRARLLEPLAAALTDVAGGDLADVLAALPYAPAMTGWHHHQPRSAGRTLAAFATTVRGLWTTNTST